MLFNQFNYNHNQKFITFFCDFQYIDSLKQFQLFLKNEIF